MKRRGENRFVQTGRPAIEGYDRRVSVARKYEPIGADVQRLSNVDPPTTIV
jgi:hypothetical protein